jgi:hypothetical protein
MNQLPKDPDNLFYDIVITNALSATSSDPVVQYIDTRSTPLIFDTSGFELSITRFYLDSTTLPVMCPIIQAKQSDINKTVYSITLSYSKQSTIVLNPPITYSYQQYIQFVPQDSAAALPVPPNQNNPYQFQDNSTGYYNVYNFQHFINMVNTAFAQALTGLNNMLSGAGIAIPTTSAPTMKLDPVTSLISINYNSAYYGTDKLGAIDIYFNRSMYGLFSSYPSIIKAQNAPLGKNYQLQINTANAGVLLQEYSTLGSWNPVKAIVFTSGSLPVVPNQIALPAIYYDGKIINSSSTSNILLVITDLIASDNMYKPFILYNPSAQYRFMSLNPNQSIRHIDVSVFWQNGFGEYIPMRLPTGGSCSMKLLFSRK